MTLGFDAGELLDCDCSGVCFGILSASASTAGAAFYTAFEDDIKMLRRAAPPSSFTVSGWRCAGGNDMRCCKINAASTRPASLQNVNRLSPCKIIDVLQRLINGSFQLYLISTQYRDRQYTDANWRHVKIGDNVRKR